MFFHFDRRKTKKEKRPTRFLVLRRKWLTLAAAGLVAIAVFAAVNYPAAVSAAATTRQLPIYCVQRDQKVCSISFDAATGDFILTDLGSSFGTFLENRQKLAQGVPTRLRPGDRFYLGSPENLMSTGLE